VERRASIAYFFRLFSSQATWCQRVQSEICLWRNNERKSATERKQKSELHETPWLKSSAAPTNNHRTFFPKCFHNLCTVRGERLVVGKAISETKKQRQTGGFRRCAHGRGSSARIWSLETNTLRWERAAEQKAMEKEPTLGDLSYRSYVSSLGPLFRPLHHSHLEVRHRSKRL
jgi:hypothetical protein